MKYLLWALAITLLTAFLVAITYKPSYAADNPFLAMVEANKAKQAAAKKAADAKKLADAAAANKTALGNDIKPLPFSPYETPKVFAQKAFGLIVIKRLEDDKPKIYAVNMHNGLFNLIEYKFGTNMAVKLFEMTLKYGEKK